MRTHEFSFSISTGVSAWQNGILMSRRTFPTQEQIMSSKRNLNPDPNADTSNQDVPGQGGDEASSLDLNAPTASTDNVPTSADTTTNPAIINR